MKNIMKNTMIISVIFLSLLLAGCAQSEGDKYYGAKYRIAENHSPNSNEDLGGLALELSKHNNAAECWVAYGNEVYDISNYLQMEPDSNLEAYCGTTSFETVVDSYNLKFSDIESVSMYKGDLNE